METYVVSKNCEFVKCSLRSKCFARNFIIYLIIFNRATWKKKFFHREKNREIAFRHKLMDKVRAAEKFNPEVSAHQLND